MFDLITPLVRSSIGNTCCTYCGSKLATIVKRSFPFHIVIAVHSAEAACTLAAALAVLREARAAVSRAGGS
jgi:hypothetical protein